MCMRRWCLSLYVIRALDHVSFWSEFEDGVLAACDWLCLFLVLLCLKWKWLIGAMFHMKTWHSILFHFIFLMDVRTGPGHVPLAFPTPFIWPMLMLLVCLWPILLVRTPFPFLLLLKFCFFCSYLKYFLLFKNPQIIHD